MGGKSRKPENRRRRKRVKETKKGSKPGKSQTRVFWRKFKWLEPKLKKIARQKDKKLNEWERMNLAYRDYLKGTLFLPLFDVFLKKGRNKIEGAEGRAERLKEKNTPPEVVDRTRQYARDAKRYYNWKTFHVGMNDIAKRFKEGKEKNLEVLSRMFRQQKRKKEPDIEIVEFEPSNDNTTKEKQRGIILSFKKIEAGSTPSSDRIAFPKQRIAIERMENGKIVKLGDPRKYYDKEKIRARWGKDRLKDQEKKPENIKKRQEIMNYLNKLLEKANK